MGKRHLSLLQEFRLWGQRRDAKRKNSEVGGESLLFPPPPPYFFLPALPEFVLHSNI